MATSSHPDPSVSPVSQIVQTNCIPTDDEVSQIKRYISNQNDQASSLDAEISQARAVLDDLVNRRDQIEKNVSDHQALLCPARRLPPDIMEEIFLHCFSADRYPTLGSTEAPTLLSHVCRGWRNLSLSISRFWSSIHILPTGSMRTWRWKDSVPYRRRIDAVEAWLARSGSHPLSISLSMNMEIDETYASTMIDILIQHSRRWKDVQLVLTADLFQRVIILTPESIPLLESISLDVEPMGWGDDDEISRKQIAFLQKSPRLHRVVLFNVKIIKCFPLWKHLTHLCILSSNFAKGLEPMAALETLRLCTNLSNCRLNIYSAEQGHPTPVSPIELPYLCLMHLRVRLEGDLVVMLHHLVLPRLQDIEVESDAYLQLGGGGWPGNSGWPHEKFVSFLSHSQTTASHNLLRLALHNIVLSDSELIEYMGLYPHIVTLSISNSRPGPGRFAINDEVLRQLSLTDSGTVRPLLPKLEHIGIRSNHAVSDDALLNFIHSRWRPGSTEVTQLRSANFWFDNDHIFETNSESVDVVVSIPQMHPLYPELPPLPSTWHFIRDLQAEGLELGIAYEGYEVLSG
jgi:hypothetical protein